MCNLRVKVVVVKVILNLPHALYKFISSIVFGMCLNSVTMLGKSLFYLWSEGEEFESTFDSEQEGKEQVKVAQDVGKVQRSSMKLKRSRLRWSQSRGYPFHHLQHEQDSVEHNQEKDKVFKRL